jgi:4-hydroxy-4-methyl-2-oxoglutarate aldolase
MAAIRRAAAGLVTSAGVRDVDAIERAAFPVFAGGIALQGTSKRVPGELDVPIQLGTCIVRPGDWIVGDRDGCVVVPAKDVDEVIERAAAKIEVEREIMGLIEQGMSSREALGLDPLQTLPAD